jgi:hypothetical protein
MAWSLSKENKETSRQQRTVIRQTFRYPSLIRDSELQRKQEMIVLSRDMMLFSQMGHRLKQLCTHRHVKRRGGGGSCTTMADLLLPQHTTAPQAFLQPYTQHKADFVACLID